MLLRIFKINIKSLFYGIYLDRYFKYSIIFWRNYKDIDKKKKEMLKQPIRKKFCAAVISNCGIEFTKFRLNFIEKLNEYKKVDMGGKCQNNIGENVKNKKRDCIKNPRKL